MPIIVLSALSTERDIVKGLESGAADYVTKPYRLRELVARMHSVLRRSSASIHPASVGLEVQSAPPSNILRAGHVRLDKARRVVTVSGQPVHLSRREFELLAVLLSPPGAVRTREERIERTWFGRNLTDTRTLDTHIRRLRVKLERDPTNPQLLVTVRGVGFRFEGEHQPPQVPTPSLGGGLIKTL